MKWSFERSIHIDFIDPVTGEKGLYHITDVTPNRDEKAKPIDWKDGHIVTPAHKAKTMLMLLVEFPDRRADYTGQVISRKYYNNPVTGGPKNLTGLWRPIENSLDGYDSPDCCWQPGDVFSGPATGVTISVGGITHYDSSDPSKSPYTADDVATVTVHKTMDADLLKGVVLSNAQLKGLTDLNFDTNIELQQRVSNARIREDSLLCPKSLVITQADGSIIPAKNIIKIVVNPGNVQVTLAKGAFAGTNNAAGATVATRAYYHFGPGAAVPVRILN